MPTLVNIEKAAISEGVMFEEAENSDLSDTIIFENDCSTILAQSMMIDESIIDPREDKTNHSTGKSYTNQSIYKEKYHDFVRNTIADFQMRHPGKLRDYRLMSEKEKGDAQKNLVGLLKRLGITKRNNHDTIQNDMTVYENDSQCPQEIEMRQDQDPDETILSIPQNSFDQGISNFSSDKVNQTTERWSAPIQHDESYIEADKSALLLSPGDFQDQDEASSCTEISFGYNNGQEDESDISVEIARAPQSSSSYGSSCETPTHFRPISCKRRASASGKRGEDLVRPKFNQDSSMSSAMSDRDNNSASENLLSSHMEALSLSPRSESRDLFEASQSPIAPHFTYDSSGDEESGRNVSRCMKSNDFQRRGVNIRESKMTSDTVETFGNTKDRRTVMREISANVRMAPGETFHIEKLPVKRNKASRSKKGERKHGEGRSRRLINFPDPLTKYNRYDKQILRDIFEWIDESESNVWEAKQTSPAGSIVFSLPYEQIIDLTLKVLLKSQNDESFEYVNPKCGLRGRSIIVCRNKEDISKWESALREGTGCSVLNHATMSLSERIRAATGERAAKYDVVLTTFDALKSPDMAIPVNASGHAVESQTSSNDGWYSNRSLNENKAQKCKQLSVLHQVSFKRIIFVDQLGRKSFLVKHGTARTTAAIALRGDSR